MVKESVLQQSYIQKSRLFLLPLVGIIKDKNFKSLNTYISSPSLVSDEYPNGISSKDEILIVTYPKKYREFNLYSKFEKLIEDEVFKSPWEKFEIESIMSNRKFIAYHELEDEIAYTFDLSDFGSDWRCFLKGRYSLFSEKAKEKIIDFRWKSLYPIEQKKLYCYLYPYKDECIKIFSDQLEVPVEELLRVKELCSKPNFNLENYVPERLKSKIEEDLNEVKG